MSPKLVDWLELKKGFPTDLKVELRKAVGEDPDRKLFDVLKGIHSGIEYLTWYIERSTALILARAKELGVPMYASRQTCRRPCATCLEKYPFHYPYFHVKTGGRWQNLSTKHVNEFLARLGLTEQQIRMHDRAVWARHRLITMFHALIINLNHMGMTTLTLELEKPVEEATVEA